MGVPLRSKAQHPLIQLRLAISGPAAMSGTRARKASFMPLLYTRVPVRIG